VKEQYEDVYAITEEKHPWFVARRALFTELAGLDTDARILDVGCGTGMYLVHLKSLGFRNLAGVETSERLRERFRDDEIPVHPSIPDETFDAVFMLDVLEHIADDTGTLARIHGILRPGGQFLISVPAHPFLWGPHDVVNKHERRYRRRELRDKLTDAGFEIERFSYWNMFCFPIACLVRWLRIRKNEDAGDVGLGPSLALKLYGWVLRVENRLLHWFDLPAGISLVAKTHTKGDAPAQAITPRRGVRCQGGLATPTAARRAEPRGLRTRFPAAGDPTTSRRGRRHRWRR
jgi:SAM-dependent methyltransferase